MKVFITTAALLLASTTAWADFPLHGGRVIPSISEHKFRSWMRQHKKRYGTKEEYRLRLVEFEKQLEHIEQHNLRDPNATHQIGLNQFSDLTDEEWDKKVPFLPPIASNANDGIPMADLKIDYTAASLNWTAKGIITSVKEAPDDCLGASYAFAAADAVEALFKQAGGQLQDFSVKQMMDCGENYQMSECDAGDNGAAFQYIKDGNKLMKETDYPFVDPKKQQQNTCKYNGNKAVAGLKNIHRVNVDPTQVKQALQTGPVASAVNGNSDTFRKYKTGVITGNCPAAWSTYVLIVGYGTENGHTYFLVKNNWGTWWGDHGYVKISDSQDSICGILSKDYLYQITN